MSRVIEAHTPLPHDDLLFIEMTGTEALSTLFDFTVTLLSRKPGISPKAVLGKDITLEVQTEQHGPKRYLSGLCTRFSFIDKREDFYAYQARLQPWLWLASRRSDSKIFQQQKVPDIVSAVLGKYGFPIQKKLSGSYRVWDYCVQYHESDLNFVSRIMEHEGIYYHFEHTDGQHTLVLCDGLASHSPLVPRSAVKFYSLNKLTMVDEEHFYGWSPREELDPGEYISSDYDFKHPKADLQTKSQHPAGHSFDAWERYNWPGGYTELGDGEQYAKTRMQALQSEQARASGVASLRSLATGKLFSLSHHPRADQNIEHLIVGVTYFLKDNPYMSNQEVDADGQWRFTVRTQPSSQPYRPQLLTPKPRSHGPQVAVVVGPPGEEIYTDEFGRVKVQFPWDRYGTRDEKSSCWMRVSHPWAGSNYGAIHIPRIGQEVIVDHIDGDPDYPIITGRVYNADQMPPWALPANATQSGILTRSSKGGAPGAGMKNGAGDANAIRFEDKAGAEQLWLHAQKDQLTEVENDEDKWVGRDRRKTIDRDELNHIQRDRTETVDRNETISVHGWRDEEVDGNETITIHSNRTERVDHNETISIGDNRTEDVGKNETVAIGINQTLSVGKMKTESLGLGNMQTIGVFKMVNIGVAYNINVGAAMMSNVGMTRMDTVGMNWTQNTGNNRSTTVGSNDSTQVGTNQAIDVGADHALKVGSNSLTQAGQELALQAGTTLKADGKEVVITGASSIKLQCGASVIEMSPGMIEIKAPLVKINC
jgi:type VI secretion system secreted protein VgrG